MQIVGPLPVSPVGRILPVLDLKPFQRVTAQILRVTGTQVVLSIDGAPVVAEVNSSELAADLKDRASAHFIVAQMEDGKTVLQLTNPSQSLSQAAGQPGGSFQNLSLHLLNELGFPANSENQIAAQAAINQRLALQPGQMDLLLRTLASQPGWGAEEANLAAAILAAGLPLTPQSLELAAHPASMSAATLANLLRQLGDALQDPEVPRALVNTVFQMLHESVMDAGLPANLPENLAQVVQFLGQPLENLVLEKAVSPGLGLGSETAGLPGISQAARQDLARPIGQLQSAIQSSSLPAELKDALSNLFETLQQSILAPGDPASLDVWLAGAFDQLKQSLHGLLLEGQPRSAAGALTGIPPGASGSENSELAIQLEQFQVLLQNSELPSEIRNSIHTVFETLLDTVRVPGAQISLPDKLAETASVFSRSLRNSLEHEIASSSTMTTSSGLISLARLQQESARSGKIELSQVLDDFLQTLAQAQWKNIPSNAPNQRQDWIESALWMRLPAPEAGMENAPIRLRIDRSAKNRPQKVDANHTHLIVQVDLPGQQVFQVEIELNQRQMKANVIVPDDETSAAAQEELSGLTENLRDQGYALGETRVEVGVPERFEKITILPPWGVDMSGVNLEA